MKRFLCLALCILMLCCLTIAQAEEGGEISNDTPPTSPASESTLPPETAAPTETTSPPETTAPTEASPPETTAPPQPTESTEHVHTYEVTDSTPATCKSAGSTSYKCSTCGATKVESIPKLTSHTYDNDCDPTCNVCGVTRGVNHSPASTWSRDVSCHWHACLVCGAKLDLRSHLPGPAATEEKDQVCLTCGMVIVAKGGHTHKLSQDWSSDSSGHWHACSSCSEKPDLEDHIFDDSCEPTCKLCGYAAQPVHSADAQWSSDETGHWHLCTLCGKSCQLEPHQSDLRGACSICGYVSATPPEHDHQPDGGWQADRIDHWNQCACGKTFNLEAHKWEQQGGSYICSVCHAEGVPTVSGHTSTMTIILIVLVILMVVAAVAVIVLLLLLKKPKHSPRYLR